MRINTTLHVSRLQKWSEVLLLALICMLLLFSEMPTWGKVLALMLMAFFVVYQRLLQKSAPQLVQLIQFDKTSWRWLVLENPHHRKTTTLEGRLISVRGAWLVLVLSLETTIKNKTQTKNWVIWRDQVDADHWRRLMVIRRFWAEDVATMKGSSFDL